MQPPLKWMMLMEPHWRGCHPFPAWFSSSWHCWSLRQNTTFLPASFPTSTFFLVRTFDCFYFIFNRVANRHSYFGTFNCQVKTVRVANVVVIKIFNFQGPDTARLLKHCNFELRSDLGLDSTNRWIYLLDTSFDCKKMVQLKKVQCT